MKELVSVDEARRIVVDAAAGVSANWDEERVALREAAGRVLVEDVHSSGDHPAFPNSAMDGFAVGSEGLEFRIVGESRAGAPFGKALQSGTAIRISTGAVVPDGAYAVVPIEQVVGHEAGVLRIERQPESGAHFRAAGKDVRRGELAFQRGTAVTTAMIPMLAMLGVTDVPVARRPRVAIVSTGDELLDPSAPDPLPPGMIRDSNGEGLAAMARALGAEVVTLLRARDTEDDLRRAVSDAMGADVVVMSGGVSVGPHDHARQVLLDLEFQLVFWRVRQRPGKPLAFATSGARLLFALPGNPVSSAVCFDQYVRPALARLVGRRDEADRWATAVLEEPLDTRPTLYHFVRGHARYQEDATLSVRATGAQDSNLISSIVGANCLIHVPEGADAPLAQERVRIEWFRYGC